MQKNIKSRQALKPQRKCAEVPHSSIPMHPFSVAPPFLRIFLSGSVPGMRNKVVLIQFIYKRHNQLKKFLSRKISKFITPCRLKKGGG